MLLLSLVRGLKVGFTGTQKGMTVAQEKVVRTLMMGAPTELHHGDCIGADATVHDLAVVYGVPIVVHPPENDEKRAFCDDGSSIKPPKPYLERNKDIVDECDTLIATPKEETNQLRSGTWSTVRYAKRKGKPVILVAPNGNISLTDTIGGLLNG